ncbi:MAG: hypothetical protein K2F81_03865 [Ruminococcus sp.]|nr:hypothetical protein [Ruminococcus sp.]
MLNFFNSILTSSLNSAGFSPYTDFEQVDTIEAKGKCLGFYSIKDVKYSDRIYSLNNSEYGMEVSGHIEVKLLGKRDDYKTFNEIDNRSFLFISSLVMSDKIVISNLSRSKIEADANLRRLKSVITFDFKILVTQSVNGG